MATRDTPSFFYTGPLCDILPTEFKALMNGYTKILDEHLQEHVKSIRDRAWRIRPYPCIAMFFFLRLDLSQHPAYDRILNLLVEPGREARFLELGSCLGQNIRKLIFDGVSPQAVYGSDLEPGFLDLGFDLFEDKDQFPNPREQFFPGDLFNADSIVEQTSNPWRVLEGKFRVINAASFLHLFDYKTQLRACCIISRLLDERAGSIFSGTQLGCSDAGEIPCSDLNIPTQDGGQYNVRTRYLHSPSTFVELWKEVEKLTGFSFHVGAQIHQYKPSQHQAASSSILTGLQELRERVRTNEILTFTVTRCATN